MTKKFLPVLFSVVLLLFLLPSVAAQAAENVKYVKDKNEFTTALADKTVDKIILQSNIQLEQPSDDRSLMIPQHTNGLVIDGNGKEITVNHGGIILGGNTTFQNLTLKLASSVRNGIIANGYTLTLQDVKNVTSPSPWSIHLFCGTMDGYNSSGTVPAAGEHGKIILKGTNEVGQVFAGNFVGKGPAKNKTWSKPSTIIVEQTGGNLGTIYGCGASEPKEAGQGDAISGTPETYPVTGAVTIQLGSPTMTNPRSVTVDGAAAKSNAAKVIINVDDNMYNPKLENLSSLEIRSGYFSAEKGLTFDSYSNAPKEIKLAKGAKLDFSGVSSSTPLNFGRFEGGGILILGEKQRVNFSGPVTGTTQVAIGRLTASQNESGKAPVKNHIYLTTPTSTATNAFHLLPYANNVDDVLKPNEKGEWAVSESGGTKPQITLSRFDLGIPQIMGNEVLIPVTTGLSPDDINTFSTLPYQLEVPGTSSSLLSPAHDNSCTFTVKNASAQSTELRFSLEVMEDKGQKLQPYLWIESENADSIPSGTYRFKIHIDKAYIQGATGTTVKNIEFTIPASSSGYSLGDLHYGSSQVLTSNAVLPKDVLDLDVSLTGESGKTVSAFVASYDKNGRMLRTVIQTGTIANNTLTLKLSKALNNTKGNISTVKVFLLDEHNAPLCAAKAVSGLR